MACVALPTCALAMAESERYLPSLIGKIEVRCAPPRLWSSDPFSIFFVKFSFLLVRH